MKNLELAFRTIGRIVLWGLAILCVIGMVQSCHSMKFPPIVGTVDAQETPEQSSHFVVEYYVDGQRYVRKLSLATAILMEGVARDEGVSGGVLIAMCLQEGSVPNSDGWYYGCDSTAVGDNGMAHGMFQIHDAYHNISPEDAHHPYFSAVFTAQRLIRKGYKHDKERAIRCHNSCVYGNDYGNRILQIARTLKPIVL